jgi:hypothetical protein
MEASGVAGRGIALLVHGDKGEVHNGWHRIQEEGNRLGNFYFRVWGIAQAGRCALYLRWISSLLFVLVVGDGVEGKGWTFKNLETTVQWFLSHVSSGMRIRR